jgi:hypothetical protein
MREFQPFLNLSARCLGNGGAKLVEQDERTPALFFTALRRLQKDNEKNHKNTPAGSVPRAGKFVFRDGSGIAPAEGRSFGLKCFFSGDMQVRFSLAAPDDLYTTGYFFCELIFVFVMVVLCKKLEQPCFNFFSFALFH